MGVWRLVIILYLAPPSAFISLWASSLSGLPRSNQSREVLK